MSSYYHQDAFDEGYIKVSDLHTIYYAQYGKMNGKTGWSPIEALDKKKVNFLSRGCPDASILNFVSNLSLHGALKKFTFVCPTPCPSIHLPKLIHIPALFLHGGPGGGTSKSNTAFFNPEHYRVILIDQRGSGKSTPVAECRENTTQLLIEDIETLRQKLNVSKWDLVFGGSWGSTLSLAYAEAHPQVVGALIIRGIFLGVEWEFDWTLRGGGPAVLFPDKWEDFVNFLPREDREDPVMKYYEILHGEDKKRALAAAGAWNKWELDISFLMGATAEMYKEDDEDWNLQHAKIESHYFMNGCFLRGEKELLKKENIEKLADIPSEVNGVESGPS